MKSTIKDYKTIQKELKKEYSTMSDYEILSLAIQIERNQILENGLNVSYADTHPASLEAIAIALGYTGKQFQNTITDAIIKIADQNDL